MTDVRELQDAHLSVKKIAYKLFRISQCSRAAPQLHQVVHLERVIKNNKTVKNVKYNVSQETI